MTESFVIHDKQSARSLLQVFFFCLFLTSILFLGAACTKSEVDIKPVEIKPIHITIDINLKVDRALDDYFGDLDKMQDNKK